MAAPIGPTETARITLGGRLHELGDGLQVRRLLPGVRRRMVGPFVFFDHIGPAAFVPGSGLDVRPHPHIGLATVTYLFAGSLRHRDSLGSTQDIVPGDVNWMTAGRGIVHSERTPPGARASGQGLEGIQTWVALPAALAECEPVFAHHDAASLPAWQVEGADLRLVAGSAYGRQSPVAVCSPLFEIACTLAADAEVDLPGEHAERAVYVLAGEAEVAGMPVRAGELLVECGGAPGRMRARSAVTALLFGGAPYGPPPHLWWNFVAAEPSRIEQAKADWRAGRFGAVPGETEAIPLPGT